VATVQLSRAVTGACGYDSMLALVCREPGRRRPHLHLFQCDHVKVSTGPQAEGPGWAGPRAPVEAGLT